MQISTELKLKVYLCKKRLSSNNYTSFSTKLGIIYKNSKNNQRGAKITRYGPVQPVQVGAYFPSNTSFFCSPKMTQFKAVVVKHGSFHKKSKIASITPSHLVPFKRQFTNIVFKLTKGPFLKQKQVEFL